jgi:hypothetical protein
MGVHEISVVIAEKVVLVVGHEVFASGCCTGTQRIASRGPREGGAALDHWLTITRCRLLHVHTPIHEHFEVWVDGLEVPGGEHNRFLRLEASLRTCPPQQLVHRDGPPGGRSRDAAKRLKGVSTHPPVHFSRETME